MQVLWHQVRETHLLSPMHLLQFFYSSEGMRCFELGLDVKECAFLHTSEQKEKWIITNFSK